MAAVNPTEVSALMRKAYEVAPFPNTWNAYAQAKTIQYAASSIQAALQDSPLSVAQLRVDACELKDRAATIAAGARSYQGEAPTAELAATWETEVVQPLFVRWTGIGPIDSECVEGKTYTPRTRGEWWELATLYNQAAATLGTLPPLVELVGTAAQQAKSEIQSASGGAPFAQGAVEAVADAIEFWQDNARKFAAAVFPPWLLWGAAAALGFLVWDRLSDDNG